MSNYFNDVGEFHRKFGIPAYDPRVVCAFPSDKILEYRMKFLREELKELDDAIAAKDLVEALDALADIVYVACGTAHYFNAPFNHIWAEVQRANLERVKCTPENCPLDKQYRADMVIKPPNWDPPHIQEFIEAHNAFARRMIRRMR